ncbi:MAG TPA: hypothetical protein VII75_07305 [Thermoanaerobaculia bacterium]|nr:hypothetical protein [Thermoanaerobaculia bacterium]
MSTPYDLSCLGPYAFEHLINALALKVLGAGSTGFAPGSDGGRDVFFEGEAPYPSLTDRWRGTWYLQAKFHAPSASADEQKWLLRQIEHEIKAFKNADSKRVWPDNWIIVTNVEPSGVPKTGVFDRAREMVRAAHPELDKHFDIWGGRKILDLLIDHPEIARHYGHFLTPGNLVSELIDSLADTRADVRRILWHLIVGEMQNQQFSKLEQAGAGGSQQPGIHTLFVDLPVAETRRSEPPYERMAVATLLQSSARSHRPSNDRQLAGEAWRLWRNDPARASVWFLRGGPGQGKSTIGHYFAQLQRAAILQSDTSLNISNTQRQLAAEIYDRAPLRPEAPRVPIIIELKSYAEWLAAVEARERQQVRDPNFKKMPRRIVTYLAEKLTQELGEDVLPGTLRRALALRSWFVFFDGLDEVPSDVKDTVAKEVRHFLEQDVVEIDADVLACCTSRPQGYSGQFDAIESARLVLPALEPKRALDCARPLLAFQRTPADAERDSGILERAMERPSIRHLMTTPLQSHIMAIVVREGGKPPERRWQLYRNFYEIIRRREANHELPDALLTSLLREKTQLLKAVHNRLGFALHARAERAENAESMMRKDEFRGLVVAAVQSMGEPRELVDVVMRATTERLVLVNTPDSGDHVRFDVRQLQEFFAGEFLYEEIDVSDQHDNLAERLDILDGDAHWREVILFAISAVIETRRHLELSVVTQALERFDYSEDASTKWLRKRLCRGSVLLAMLLNDGVLEQDQRVRARFRNAFSSALASTEVPVLAAFQHIGTTNSRRWVIDSCIDALDYNNVPELVGAAALLVALLDDDDRRLPRVTAWFEDAPPAFLALVAAVAARLVTNCPAWFLHLLSHLLEDDRWLSLSADGLKSVIDHLRHAPSIGRTVMEADLLSWMLLAEPSTSDGQTYGAVLLERSEVGWAGSSPIAHWTTQDPPSAVMSRLLHAILRLSTYRDGESLRALATVLKEIPAPLLHGLPEHVKTQLPLDWFRHLPPQIEELTSASDDDAREILDHETFRGRRVPRYVGFKFLNMPVRLEQWNRLATDYPAIAFFIFGDPELSRYVMQGLDYDVAAALLVRALLEEPEYLLTAPGSWGKLVILRPGSFSAIRNAAKSVAHLPVLKSAFRTEFHRIHALFPSDAILLPHLLPSAVRFLDQGWLPYETASLADNVDQRPEVRISAAILTKRPWSDVWKLVPLLDAQWLRWFLEVVVSMQVQGVLNDVLDLSKVEYDIRTLADPLLQKARERSEMPISNVTRTSSGYLHSFSAIR